MNIDINPSILSETIKILKKDNLNVKETINLIYENIFKLTDESVWNSPEKSVVMNELIPYLEKEKNSIYNELNNCVFLLDNALNKYMMDNNVLEKNVSKLSDVEIIEEL